MEDFGSKAMEDAKSFTMFKTGMIHLLDSLEFIKAHNVPDTQETV